jgi:hypothetical protein
MGDAELLQELEQQGCQFKVDSGILMVRGALTDELREVIRQHKPDILAELKRREAREQGQVVDFESEARTIRTALRIHGTAKIYSRTLDDVVYWVRDDREATKVPKGAVVYTLGELKHLVDIKSDPEALNQIHQAKKIFGGKLMDEVQDPFAIEDGLHQQNE